jgi:predicted short-subunit dehydrogenase-like oxidoreductase (DUF2520 family)
VPRLFVVGPGRAGLGLARAALAAGLEVTGVQGRRARDTGPPLGPVHVPARPGDYPAGLARATAVFVAVQDRELDAALAPLAGAPLAPGAVVLQASGSAEPETFAGLRAAGVACGTFHPLVPLAAPEHAPALLHGAWVGVDGDPAARDTAHALAARVGAHVLAIPAGERARYHAAAVFASNFPVVLAAVAERLLAEAGVARAEARPAVRHLLSSAAANLARGDDAALALTGPIARGDATTVARHLAALAGDAEAEGLYRALARATLRLTEAAAPGAGPDGTRVALAALLG